MSTIISEHLHTSPSTVLSSPLPFYYSFLYSFLCFSDISIRQTSRQTSRQTLRWTLPMTPVSIFILTYVHFYVHFHVHFLCYCVSPFISRVLVFLSHIVIDCPLAGLYPFLLGSPARCTSYCSYLCASFCKSDHSHPLL